MGASDTNEILDELQSGDPQEWHWRAQDDSVLITCCGLMVEYDCPWCATCGRKNPLVVNGLI